MPGPNSKSERPGYFQPPPSNALPQIEADEADKMLEKSLTPVSPQSQPPVAIGSAEIDMSELEAAEWASGAEIVRPEPVLDFSGLQQDEPPDSKEATLSRIEGSIGVKLAELAKTLDDKNVQQLERIMLRGELLDSMEETRNIVMAVMKALDQRYKHRTGWEKTSYPALLESFVRDLLQREEPGLTQLAEKLLKSLESSKDHALKVVAKKVRDKPPPKKK